MTEVLVPISPGELLDKLTILEIKSERMTDSGKLANVRFELQRLSEIWQACEFSAIDVSAERMDLKRINESLWQIEDDIREEERAARFGSEFVRLARAVYVTNDRRAAVKRLINEKLGSRIVEEKSYAEY